MINLIKMNFYRMFRSRLFYILLLVNFGILLLLTSLEGDPETQELDRQIIAEQGINPDETDSDIGMTLGLIMTENTPLEDIYAGGVGSGFILVLTGIFASVYSDEERKNGFLKNLTVGARGKKYIFASKAPVLFVFCLVQMLVALAATYIGSNLTGEYVIVHPTNLIHYIVTQIILHTAFGLLIMTFYEMFRNVVLNILVTVFASVNFFGLMFSMLEMKIGVFKSISEAFGGRLEIVQYLLVTRVKTMSVNDTVFPYVSSIVLAVAGVLMYLILGMVIYQKRDTI